MRPDVDRPAGICRDRAADPGADRDGERAAAAAAWALCALADRERRPQAVLHPLGFLCYPLRRGPGFGICVHVWLPERSGADAGPAPIHSHSWDLLSQVLVGRVGNELICASSAPVESAGHRIYQVHSSAGGVDEIVATAQCVRCSRRETQYTEAGRAYRLPGGEFHNSVVPAGTAAATVLLADSLPGGCDRLLGPLYPPGGDDWRRTVRRLAGPKLSRKAAESVLDLARDPFRPAL
jgi:hypothetical protein